MQNAPGIRNDKGVFLTHLEYDALMARDREREIEITYLKQELAELRRM